MAEVVQNVWHDIYERYIREEMERVVEDLRDRSMHAAISSDYVDWHPVNPDLRVAEGL